MGSSMIYLSTVKCINDKYLKEYCCISFFKDSLLNYRKNLLVKPGPNSQAARLYEIKE